MTEPRWTTSSAVWRPDGTRWTACLRGPVREDADFVTIRGEHYRGRPTIAAGHSAIFNTIFAGSTVRLTVEQACVLRPEVLLMHVRSDLEAPRGPLAGRHIARFTLVLTKDPGGWQISALHNTLEGASGPPR